MSDIAVRAVIFTVTDDRLQALLVRRSGTVWTLPGGALPAGATLQEAAEQALAEQAGLTRVELEQLYTFDDAPAGAVAVAYLALVRGGRHSVAPGDDVVQVRWFRLDDLPALDATTTMVLAYGHNRIRHRATYAPIAFQLLPEAFTLSELQTAYEAILGRPLDPRNFRRDVIAAGAVAPAGRQRTDGPGRPAQLYRGVAATFAVAASERRATRAIAALTEPPATDSGA